MNHAPELLRFIIQLFCISTMAAMGLGITLDDIRAPFRNRLALAIIVIANNVIIPLLGLVIVAIPQPLLALLAPTIAEQFVVLTGGLQVGFLLLLLASGNLLAPLFVRLVDAPVAFARGTMVVLVGVSTILVPFVLPALSGLIAQAVDTPDPLGIGSIFLTLLLYQLLPLALGILVKTRYDLFAGMVRSLFTQLTSLALLTLVAALLLSGQRLITAVEPIPPVRTDLFTSKSLTAVDELDAGRIPADLAREFKDQSVILPDPADLIVLAAGKSWAIVDPATTYLVDHLTKDVTPTLGISTTTAVTYTFTITPTESTIEELDGRIISTTIENAFDAQGKVLVADLVLVREAGARWVLVDDAKTYQIEFKDDQFTIFQESAQPVGLMEAFLAALDTLPDIGPVIDFLLQLLNVGIPYLFFIAVAAALMMIGYYSGRVVHGLVRTPTDETAANDAPPPPKLPETLAFTATLRNVSLALIVASEHLVNWQPATGETVELTTIITLVVFFVVCLLVAAHQAAQWKAESIP